MEHQNHTQTKQCTTVPNVLPLINHKPFEVSAALYAEITPSETLEDKVFLFNY